jgi:hypothetical protein
MHVRLRIIPGLGPNTKLKRVTPGQIQQMYRDMQGGRLGEDLGLKWPDFDEVVKTVRVCRTLQELNKRTALQLGGDQLYPAEYAKSDGALRCVLLTDRTTETRVAGML